MNGEIAIVQVIEYYDLNSIVGRLRLFLALLHLSTANVSGTVCLTPIGHLEVVQDLRELVIASLDILDALVPMHQLKIIHGDLR